MLQLPSAVDNIKLIATIDLKNSLREDYFDLIPQSSNRDINVEFSWQCQCYVEKSKNIAYVSR